MLSDYKNQEFQIELLKAHISKQRLSSSYLFTGRDAEQKLKMAADFARALNCEQNHMFVSCDCPPCRKIDGHTHPDILWIGEDLDARSIKIEEIRQVRSWTALKPYEAKWKVVVALDADRMTAESQNALLKTLEEPPPRNLFLLLVENKDHLLETIRSRCFEIRLNPVPETADTGFVHESGPFTVRSWIDYLEPFQNKPREAVMEAIDRLLENLYREMRRQVSSGEGGEQDWQKAIETVCETREAVEENVNTKLALTRLTMKLGQVLPRSGVV